jgi:chitin disaccharide deacetylase
VRPAIVNADDLGYSSARTSGILHAFEAGLINSASMMATMPNFDDACAGALGSGVASQIGVHLALTEGEPVTNAIRRCRRLVGEDGTFRNWRTEERVVVLSRSERSAVRDELRAQVGLVRSRGFDVTHLDSHHHVHTQPALIVLVVRLARELGIGRVRIVRNCGPGQSRFSVAPKWVVNGLLRRASLAGTRHFGNATDFQHFRAAGASARDLRDFELMTHPTYDESGTVVDLEHPGRTLRDLLVEAEI